MIDNSTILITGGLGFVPSSLADKFAEEKTNTIVLVDNLLTGIIENKPSLGNVVFVEGDANDFNTMQKVFSQYKFDYVFHYAAVVGVKRTLDNPIMVLDDIKGIEIILELSKNSGVKRVFYSSSSEVYGEPVHLPQHEITTPLNSKLPYAIVKNVGEAYFRSYQQEYELDYTIFRFFNTYGPKQSEDFVLSKFIKAALNNDDITVYGDGSQTRTFCYIDDNVEATLKCLNENKYVNDVLNLGSEKITTIYELAQMVIDITKSSSKIVHLPALPEGDMTRRQPDSSRMNRLLKRDLISLEEGVKNILSERM